MPITLRDAVSQLQLRPTTTPVDQLALEREQMLGADANPIKQGWVSAGAGMDAYDLLAQANAAERQGDLRSAQALELQAKDHLARAQAWAPTTQKFTDIDGPGSAANWLGGQIGNLRTSVAPMVGGVAGRVAGGLAGGLVAGPAGAAIGANLGGLGGAFIPGYNLEYNESVGQAMLDPQIRAQRTTEEIHRTSQGKGTVAGLLESIVPAGVGKLVVEGVGKRAIGKTIAKEMGEEALTEGSQNLVGQAAQNHLRGDPMTQFDYQDAFNDAMAGAVGGGAMAGGGVAIGKARDALVGGAEKVADIARDPTGAVIDKIKSAAEARGRKMAQEEIASESPEQTVERVFGKKPPSITDSLRDDEREMDDATLDRTRHEQAMADAQEVLSAPAGMYSQAEKEAAAQFQAGQLSWDKVREVRRQGEADRKSIDDVNELLRAAGLDDKGEGEAKSSLMRPNGSEGNPGKFGEVTRRVAMLQRKYDNKATQEAAQRTVSVADVLVSGGYWPKEIVDAAKSTTQKEGMLTMASTLLTWMKYGMQDKRYENDDSLVDALVGKYGEAAVGMLQNAYDVGVSSGLMPRNDELFAERRVQALDALKQQEDLSGVVLKNLSAEWKRHVLKNVSGKWIEDKTALASLVREVRRIASTGGSREDQRVMEILFPNEENRHEVQKALYTPSISKNAFGTESNVTQIGREQGETGRAGKTSRSAEDLDSEDYERQVDKLSGESDEGGETREARGVKYIHAPGGHAFRKRDEGSRAAMKAAKEKHAGNGVRVEEVGVVDAALDKARVAAGGQLSTEQRHQVLEKLARRYLRRDMPQRPATPPEDASALIKSVHKQDLQKWQAKLERTAKALNRTHVVLKSSAVDEEKSGELDYEAVRAAQLDRKLDDPRNRPEEGVLWIGTKRGAKMLISAPQILRLAFRSGEAHQDVGFSGKTKEGDEITVGFGSPQNIYNMLLRSLADIALMPEFNGTWGFVEAGGTPVQVAGNTVLPDNFTLLKKTPKRDALTMEDVGRAKADYNRRISSLKDGDVDPSELNLPTRRMQATVWQKLRALTAVWKSGELDDSQQKRLEGLLNKVAELVENRRKEGARGDALLPVGYHKVIGKWMAALDLKAGVVDVADGHHERDRAVDGLAAYDPDKAIVRGEDDRGMVTAGDVEMTAQTVVGTPKKLDAEGVKSLTGPVPTSPTPGRVSRSATAQQVEAGKQQFVELLRNSVDALLGAIAKMSAREIALTTTALGDFAKLSSTNVDTLAKEYFQGNETAARMFTSRLTRSNVSIRDAIAARSKELGDGQSAGVHEKDNETAFGEGRKADSGRTEARVVARRNGERTRSQSDDGGVDQERRADRPAGNGRGVLLTKLRTIKPANAIHKRAVENLIALLEGKKEGDIAKAMNDMVRWDQTLGELSTRQREQLKTWVEKRGGQDDTQVPIEAYDDELAYDPEQAEYDRAQVTGKDSKQEAGNKQATPEEMAQVEAELHRILGDDVRVLFEDLGGKSGEWTKEDTAAVIRLAVNGDIMATGFHEAIHQLFSLLKQHQGQAVVDALQRIAKSPVMQGRLRKLLKAHPEAMGQLSDPEEAVAYMFQFWMMDPSGFKLGPETKTLFQKIKGMLDKAFALLSKTVRDRLVNEKREESDAIMAEYLMTKLASGVMADKTGRTAVVEALNADAAKHNAALTHLGEGYTKLITGVGRFFATAEGLLESYNNPHLTMLARQMHQRAGEAMGSKAGYLEAVRFVSNHYEAKINAILANHSKDDLELARSWLVQHPDKAHPSPEVNEVVGKIQSFLKEMRGYIEKMGIRRLEEGKWVAIDFRKHYFPHVWDTAAVSENMEQFVLDLMNEHGDKLEAIAKEAGVSKEEVAQTILQRVMNPNAQVDLEETTSDLGMTPAATAINRRSLDWLDMEVFDKYMSKDLGQILHSYTHNIVQRGEYQSRFGYGGEKLKETVDSALLHQMGGESLTTRAVVAMPEYERQWEERRAAAEAAGREFSEPYPTLRSVGTDLFKKDEGAEAEAKIKDALTALEPAFKTIMAMEGTLGNDITPGLRKAENWITTYQNFRVLAPGLFSSFMDIMGVVREGGEFKDAWGAFVAGIKEAKNIMQDKRDDSYMMQRAELFGSADAGSFSSAVGQHSTSVYMSGKAKEWSDKLFKYNGMEGWNRGVRAYATLVAERILLDWARNGINSKDPAEVARVERLFGKGFDVSKIKLDDSGNVDATDPKNIAAVNRWVHDAVIAPNAAHRPYWMSDPHFQVVAHLKSFSYSAHAVMLKQVAAQARLGNYRPALVTLLGYAPIAIAAGAIKEMLIPGDEPPWMKGGLDGYLEYGWDRAGVLGIPQMYAQNLFDSDPVAAFGPTANQVQDLLTVQLGELKVGPVGWRDHRTFEEMMGAAPFGSVLRRYGADVDDWIAK